MANKLINIDKWNINIAFKVVGERFIYWGKITFKDTKFKKVLFSSTKVIRYNILFANNNHYTYSISSKISLILNILKSKLSLQ